MRLIAGDEDNICWRHYEVYIDGKLAKFVVEADDVAGMLIQTVVDPLTYRPLIIDGEVSLKTRKGVVEFRKIEQSQTTVNVDINTEPNENFVQSDLFYAWGMK